jgi:HD superfamily phosphodiesterase
LIFYAHSKENQPPKTWQPLEEHLENVANLAAEFAAPFGGECWAWNAGWLHDLGMWRTVLFQPTWLIRPNFLKRI